MLNTLYFDTKADYDRYWAGTEPGSNYLCIIKEMQLPNGEIITNSAITVNNDINGDGTPSEIGTSAISYSYIMTYSYIVVDNTNTELEAELDLATEKSNVICVGQAI